MQTVDLNIHTQPTTTDTTTAASPLLSFLASSEFSWTLLFMLAASHTVERATHGKIPAKWIALAVGLFLTVFFLTGTHRTLVALLSIISKRGVTLFSPAGIQGFCTDLQQLASTNILQVLTLAASLYITLQTFCIPGTIALNAAIGALIGTTLGVPLAVILGTIGACCCYLLSTIFGAKLADAVDLRLMKGKGVPKLRAAVQRYRSDLLVYILFLRLTPVLPNWLVNLASPVVGVPLKTFALATFIGIIPQSYFSVRFGSAVVAAAQHRYATATFTATGSSSGAGGHSGAPADEALPAIVTRADQIFLCLVAVLIVVVARLKKRFSGAVATPGHNAVE